MASRGDRPICVDLFAGAGGLALGMEQAGFDVIAGLEYDPIHAAIHELNFPESTTICLDARKVTGEAIRAACGISRRTIDAVVGGPPCQGFSLIGHRVLEDPRNELVFHFLRIVDELRPRVFLFENVAGMASGEHHKLLDELVSRFQDAGYRVRLPYRILNAAEYGVPQDRRRLILLGARSDTPLPQYPEPLTRHRTRAVRTGAYDELPLVGIPLGPSVADAISDLPDIDAFPGLGDTDVLEYALNGASDYALRLRGALRDDWDYSYRRKWDSTRLTGCLRAEHTAESRRRFAGTRPGMTEPISRFYRLPPDGLCNTLRAGTASDRGAFTSPRPIHPKFNRCISIREAARLHSYPDWFRFHRTIWHGFRQIGNSVPPMLGRAVGASLMKALGTKPTKPRRTLQTGPDTLASFTMSEAARHFGVIDRPIPSRRQPATGAR